MRGEISLSLDSYRIACSNYNTLYHTLIFQAEPGIFLVTLMSTFTFTFEKIIKLSYDFRDKNKIVMIFPPLAGKILLKVEDINSCFVTSVYVLRTVLTYSEYTYSV